MIESAAAAAPSSCDWSAAEVLAWLDSFRSLLLESHPSGPMLAYDSIRASDPMRRSYNEASRAIP